MEILGIGPLELMFILIIALVILGPGDMAKTGRTLGRFLRKIVTSPEWRTVQKASHELKYLPNRLMREASLEDLKEEMKGLNKIGSEIKQEVKQVNLDLSSWTTPPSNSDTPDEITGPEENSIMPPEIHEQPDDTEANI